MRRTAVGAASSAPLSRAKTRRTGSRHVASSRVTSRQVARAERRTRRSHILMWKLARTWCNIRVAPRFVAPVALSVLALFSTSRCYSALKLSTAREHTEKSIWLNQINPGLVMGKFLVDVAKKFSWKKIFS